MISNLYWLSEAQMERLKRFPPKGHGKPRVDYRPVLSGIIFINRNGLRWCDAPREYGPAKALCSRWKRWSDNGIFIRIIVGLAAESAAHKTIIIDATYLKVRRTASRLRVKVWRISKQSDGLFADRRGARARSGEPKVA